ncbi:MAG: transporter substrate-binding domain-containing protein [Deltaproteobacteria bacterium]|nr:transporter substrate-binding domain-containing protein [Deltaproteobacteria bacterium]
MKSASSPSYCIQKSDLRDGSGASFLGATTQSVRPNGLLLAALVTILLGLVLACPPSWAGARIELTNEEQAWLAANPDKLTLYFNTEFPPIEFISESGSFIGMGADVISRIEDLLDVSFLKVPSDDWNAHLAALKSGACAVAPTIVKTEEREKFAFFTQPYATVPVVIITPEETSGELKLNDFKGKRIGVVSGYATEKFLRDQALVGHFEVVPVANVPQGLQMVSFGRIDAFAENLAVAAHFIDQMGIPNLRVAGTTNFSFAWSIGVSREYPLLYGAMAKALAAIPEKDLTDIRRKWIVLATHSGIAPETLRLIKAVALFALLLSLGLGVISFFLKRSLNQKVQGIRRSEIRANAQRSAIVELALDKGVVEGDLDLALSRVTKTVAETVGVARTGIWVLSEGESMLNCLSLRAHDAEKKDAAAPLDAKSIPLYLEALRAEGRIFAPDALNDPRTSELVDLYLAPLGIASMLDTGILIEGRLVSVVSLEHVGRLRHWEPDEEAFARTAAAMVGQIMANARRREAEKALLERNRQLQILSDNLPNGYVYQAVVDPDGGSHEFLYLSAGVERMHGISAEAVLADSNLLYGQLFAEDLPLLLEREKQACQNLSLFRAEARFRDPSGTVRWMSLSSSPRVLAGGRIVWDGISLDVTERKQAEEEREKLQGQLLQAQKMESMGILAGGIAHDFNNLLHAMGGNIELLLQGRAPDHPETSRLNAVVRSMDRARRLVQQLLFFSRKAESRRISVDLNREAQETARILERTIPKMVALEIRLQPDLWKISSDPVQIEQILLNLAGNAVDAMPDGGTISIETGNVILDEGFVLAHPEASAGRHVLLTLSDTGFGMDADTLSHIYDPFFTTKEVGKGTGLGLASVYGIVKSHGGHIQCDSEPGRGTTFRIYWPAADETDAVSDRSLEEASPGGGDETILVVDDEPEIRELTAETLEALGYTVLVAASGEEALEIFRRQGNGIGLVLLDLNMPGLGGQKCLAALREIDPGVRVVIASGYAATDHRSQALASGAWGFIAKPYRMRELADVVRSSLDGG